MEAHQEELGLFDTTAATIRFPFGKPLPVALVTVQVKERMLENENKAKKRSSRFADRDSL
jgi:uncharacterized protein YdhG (YjbR/CyaY superfamily)